MTKLGWPVAQPRFTSRPSASTMIDLPSGQITSCTWGFTSTHLCFLILEISISESKWPMLQTIARCFIAFMCSSVITNSLPVVVTKMSPRGAAFAMVVTS